LQYSGNEPRNVITAFESMAFSVKEIMLRCYKAKALFTFDAFEQMEGSDLLIVCRYYGRRYLVFLVIKEAQFIFHRPVHCALSLCPSIYDNYSKCVS
jgi:hypothetical protein